VAFREGSMGGYQNDHPVLVPKECKRRDHGHGSLVYPQSDSKRREVWEEDPGVWVHREPTASGF
jgi:hypothetical protein